MDVKCAPEYKVITRDPNKAAFRSATRHLSSRDVVEEFIAAGVWPLGRDWSLDDVREGTLKILKQPMICPPFNFVRPEDKTNEQIVEDVEYRANVLCGPYKASEHNTCKKVLPKSGRLNRVFEMLRSIIHSGSDRRRSLRLHLTRPPKRRLPRKRELPAAEAKVEHREDALRRLSGGNWLRQLPTMLRTIP
jgi:hypothetical protein